MKKLISSILILAMVLCCFVSCNSNEIEEVSNSSKQVVQVKFDGKAKSMSVGTVYPEAGTLYWAYTAEKKNGGGTTGKTETLTKLADGVGFEKTITFSVGTWDFELYGFNTEGERASAIASYSTNNAEGTTKICTYHAATTQTLKFSRNITSIPLEAAPYSKTGYLNGKIMLTATTVDSYIVGYKIGDTGEWVKADSNKDPEKNKSVKSILSGPNTIKLRLYENDANFGTENYLNETVLSNVTIYSGLTTTIGGSWDDPTTAAQFVITTKPATKGFAAVTGTNAGRTSCEWVQLWEGGPKWATFNVGATIDDYSEAQFKVGATDPKNYSEETFSIAKKTLGGTYCYKGSTDWGFTPANNHVNDGSDNVEKDTASSIWGVDWKVPAKTDYENLLLNTDVTYCDGVETQYVTGCTIAGVKFSGKSGTEYENNSIFFPSAGYSAPTIWYDYGEGLYWTSTAYYKFNADVYKGTANPRLMENGTSAELQDAKKSNFYVRAIYVGN